MNSWPEVLKKEAVLFAVTYTGFALHGALFKFLEVESSWIDLHFAYHINFILAAAILAALMRMPERLQNSLGFLYLGGSMLKFLVFFIAFYPAYKEDGDISKLEFATFFIPYSLCLIVETSVLVRMLNRQP